MKTRRATLASSVLAAAGLCAALIPEASLAGAAQGSYPSQLVGVGGTLYFVARTPEHGHELWKSNGTAADTREVDDIWTVP
jgi:ELWxxDGT repeat protein